MIEQFYRSYPRIDGDARAAIEELFDPDLSRQRFCAIMSALHCAAKLDHPSVRGLNAAARYPGCGFMAWVRDWMAEAHRYLGNDVAAVREHTFRRLRDTILLLSQLYSQELVETDVRVRRRRRGGRGGAAPAGAALAMPPASL